MLGTLLTLATMLANTLDKPNAECR